MVDVEGDRTVVSLNKRQLNALLAIKLSSGGLRRGAHPATMPLLVAAGFVEERPKYRGRPGETCWFLTDAGRKVLANAEPKEVKTPDLD